VKITTAGRVTNKLVQKAKQLSSTHQLDYVERTGHSIEGLKNIVMDDLLIVGSDKIFFSPYKSSDKVFFHPNLSMIRAKRIANREQDPFIEIAQLEKGMSVLDCTLGLASDSIVASYVVGPSGTVVGVEGDRALSILTEDGLKNFTSGWNDIDDAMKRIHVHYADHYEYLQSAPTNGFDVVYFDPMFDKAISSSHGINTIRQQAIHTKLSKNVITEAKRVAKKRVILKDHWQSSRFHQLGFIQHIRKTSAFHFGTIELQ
jgi:ubiquinone/menaquinone biosynthesis C-methylase UbiE